MSAFTADLAHWLREHHGIVACAELDALGITRPRRRALVAAGVLVPIHEGVYRSSAHLDTFESQCAAASAADRTVVVSCLTAGRLWGLRRCGSTTSIHATTDRLTKPILRGVTVHRSLDLPPEHVVTRDDGIRLTSPPRTVFDLARHLSDLDLESVIEQILDRRLCNVPTLYAIGRRLCTRGRPGTERFARMLSSRPTWRRPADSHPEVVLRDALEHAGLRGLEVQPSLRLPDGSTIHPDLGIRSERFFIEVDDAAWHAGRFDAAYDRRRDRQLRMLGACVERVDTRDIRDALVDTVSDLLASRDRWLADRPALTSR